MTMTFDVSKIEGHRWRQGAVLGHGLLPDARKRAPQGLTVADDDWLIVTSHDCDVVNSRLEKEPTIEILRGVVVAQNAADKQQSGGRNPRVLEFETENTSGVKVVLRVKVHERWTLPRELLSPHPPALFLGNKQRRLIAEWLAKRYIRAAFPTEFDRRWRTKMSQWTSLLLKQSQWVQGVYLRLDTLNELEEDKPYQVHLIVAAPQASTKGTDWETKREEIERGIETFWTQFGECIECRGVEVLRTNELTLADIELYQRFDADWVSFADDSPATPANVDMTA